MNKEKYLNDLNDIKDMMNRSSRFMSLSGLSGVIVGSIAILAAVLAYYTIYKGQDYFWYRKADLSDLSMIKLFLLAAGTLCLSLLAGIYFSWKKAKKDGHKLWDYQAYRLVINLLIPLSAGGIFSLMLLFRGFIGLIAPVTLLFYGLALVNASKYSIPELRSLGIAEIIIGLVATWFIGYGLVFWAIGFGVLHIAYGIVMHVRYGS